MTSLKPQQVNNIINVNDKDVTVYYEASDDNSFETANVISQNDSDSYSANNQVLSSQVLHYEGKTKMKGDDIHHSSSYHLKSKHRLQSRYSSSNEKERDCDKDDKSLMTKKTDQKEKEKESQSKSSLSISFSPIDKVMIQMEPVSLDIAFLKLKLRLISTKAKNVSKDNKHIVTLLELQNFSIEQSHSPVWVFKFSSDGRYIAIGGKKGSLKIYEVMTHEYEKYQQSYNENDIMSYLHFINEEPLRTYNYHSADIIDLSWSHFNKDQLLTASLDSFAILWSIDSAYPLMKFHHGGMVTTISFSPINPNEFVTGCLDRFIRIWPIQKDSKPEYFNIKEKIISVSYSPSGDSLAIGTHNGKVLIYDLIPAIRYNCSFSCRNHLGRNSRGKKVTNIEFVNKSSALITTSDSRLRYVTMPDGKLIHKYKGLTNESSMIRAHNDDTNDMIISGSEDRYCYLWHRLNVENKNKKNYSYEYFRPFANDVVECSTFACEQAMSAYLKKVYKLTTKFFIQSIILNSTDSGRFQVVLNITETNSH